MAPVLEQATAALPQGFSLAGFRSRGTAKAFVLEAAVACPEDTDVRVLREVERLLAGKLAEALPGVALSLSVQAVPL